VTVPCGCCCLLLQNPPPVDVIVTKRVVNSNTATLGSGDLPTFNFEIKLTAAAGTTVTTPVLVDTMSAGLQIQGAIGASNGENSLHFTSLCPADTCGTLQTLLSWCVVSWEQCNIVIECI
jgi:hypothetical protein